MVKMVNFMLCVFYPKLFKKGNLFTLLAEKSGGHATSKQNGIQGFEWRHRGSAFLSMSPKCPQYILDATNRFRFTMSQGTDP